MPKSLYPVAGMWAWGAALALAASGCAPTASGPDVGAAAESRATQADEIAPGLFQLDHPVRHVTHVTFEPAPGGATGPQIVYMPTGPAAEVASIERLPSVAEEEQLSRLPAISDSPSGAPSYVPPPQPVREEEPPAAPHPASDRFPAPGAHSNPIPPAPIPPPSAKPARAPLSPDRAAALAGVGRQVRQLAENATSLAQRGATFAARAELLRALRLGSQALDTVHGTSDHARALAAGLRAIKEAGDFSRLGPADVEPDLESVVGGHRTPVLDGAPLDKLTATEAVQRYLTYAQEQLAASAEGLPEASLALYGLGRLEPLMHGGPENHSLGSLNGPRSMAFHQAAMRVDARNYRAANELAVWLARYGQHGEARKLLVQSLSIKRVPEAWHNLAVVHDHLGEPHLATLARGELELARTQPQGGGREMVEWLDAQQFATRPGAGPAR